ncbi:MAG: hypothetical protein COS39_02730 [Hydrogenophilales bacterium CG03_land_8_20_14_0_80_62_28]|nr:TusE/DsrC/DsvC family sulfur relay protein [Betaproteobacteria bacterium]OIO77967.1 MAG: hypothetical protein AUJ86_06935 [Hydrogenophilaceae bacterium CG1_02_62_390]PIV23905.1 MAG: hypothetical protein COS39_02730 [Hydrogenophilales bacterium CG03_land_8_20_14_0_80_62_28]PIW39308.1 MAG: hypothetical protein COW23_02075 [Hydrogenophilales bacterium CG15_BIG_FIL_POST_REV_8_21_14_020_62_31]PIW72470.1 MAG: hypothetical protein COW07_02850 [Hydrogenophilales bacterium CG12_big_fil_rev_8_21_14_0_
MLDINKLILAENLGHRESGEFAMDLEPWSEERALQLARSEGLDLNKKHMAVLRWLRDRYAECGPTENGRALSHAMEENFMTEGGLKYLYRLFPQGPVYQGCHFAGVPLPPGSLDQSFGSRH